MTSAAVDPTSASVLYISVAGWKAGILRSGDGGRSWVAAASGLPPGSEVTQVIAAGSPTIVYAIVDGRVFRSEDSGFSWEPAGSGLPPVSRLSASAVSDSIIYADDQRAPFVFTRTLFRSADAGRTWIPVLSRPSIPLVAVDPREANRLYVATEEGLSVSEDGGATWHVTSLPLSPAGPMVTSGVGSIAVDPGQGTLYATSYTCFASRFTTTCANALYRSLDTGSTFVRVSSKPSSGSQTTVLAVDSTSAVYDAGEVSRDAGATWSLTGLRSAFYAASFSSSLVLTATNPFASEESLLSSTDQGRTWSALIVPGCSNPLADELGRGLCLGGRFATTVSVSTPTGPRGGVSRKGTDDAGFFWFFSDNNLELAVKVVDGRPVNGKYWVFVAALTDLEYDLTVIDTLTGVIWLRHNPAGRLASLADTEAF
ncbi:MAG: hypothetical protein ABI682_11830 [Acidobacteriota bacterium]